MYYRKHRQYLLEHRRSLLAAGAFLIATVVGLWSWNTLAELGAWPRAEYRHVLAAFAILYLARQIVFPARRTFTAPKEVADDYSPD